MKREKLYTLVQSFVLAFLLSFGGVGCMVSGLGLNGSLGKLWTVCALMSLFTSCISNARRGGWLLCLAYGASSLWLYRGQALMEQILDMLCHISRFYDHAYGWGCIYSPQDGRGPMELPLILLGFWISGAVSWSTTQGDEHFSALLLSAVPLAACVVVTDTVPEAFYLYLWLLGYVLLLLSSGARRRNPLWGPRAVALAALPTALALGLLFLVVPQEGYDMQPDALQEKAVEILQELPKLWEDAREELSSQVDGLVVPETVRLDNAGPRHLGDHTVMEVTSQITGTMYLRGSHYDTYSGTGWTATGEATEIWTANLDSYRDMGEISIHTRRSREVLYLPYYPLAEVTLEGGRAENTENSRTYSFTHYALPMGWQRTLAALTYQPTSYYVHPQEVRALNLRLPGDTRAWATGLLDRILTEDTTIATEKAQAIANFVRSSARYDLNTPRMPAGTQDFAQWFLEESDTGYCVHFATATVVLLRAAGIEARYVEGYTADARKGQTVAVTADRAHAWAEYYEPLLGIWIPLEATPADLGGEGEGPVSAEETEATDPIPPERTEPQQATESVQASTNPGGVPDATDAIIRFPNEPADLGWLWKLLGWTAGIIAAFAALEGQRQLRLSRRRKQLRRGNSQKKCLARWRQLEQLHRILKTTAPEECRVLAEKAKYSPHPIPREELAVLDTALRNAGGEMRKRPWYWQLVDRYIFCVLD